MTCKQPARALREAAKHVGRLPLSFVVAHRALGDDPIAAAWTLCERPTAMLDLLSRLDGDAYQRAENALFETPIGTTTRRVRRRIECNAIRSVIPIVTAAHVCVGRIE